MCLGLVAAACRDPNPYFQEPPFATTSGGTTTAGLTTSGTALTEVAAGTTTTTATSSGALPDTDPVDTSDTEVPAESTGIGPLCGDGTLDEGEQCDDGASNGNESSCKLDCTDQVCGDGFTGPGEGCDDGNTRGGDGCAADCVPESCGNGVVEAPEACDDAQNGDQDDGCTDLCTLPACGDGYVQEGTETCDDGVFNSDEGGCTLVCQAAVCGDGLLFVGVEECDEGSQNSDSSYCTAACVAAKCGDGLINLNAEACDDGNLFDADTCDVNCDRNYKVSTSGDGTTCIQFEGALRCWGSNGYGELGQGDTAWLGDNPGELPTPDIDVGGAVVDHSVGFYTVCVSFNAGAVRCFGNNDWGSLGINSKTNIGDGPGEMPPADALVGNSVRAIRPGRYHPCAITTNRELRCWGRNTSGQLGQGVADSALGDDVGELPLAGEIKVGFLVADAGGGETHTCARSAEGAVRCWGGNQYGQLGHADAFAVIGDEPGELPAADVELGGPAAQLAVGYLHNCALMQDGAVRCWGFGMNGRLGNESTSSVGLGPGDMPPVPVKLGGPAVQVVVGEAHTCALMENGAVRCFGYNAFGQLGQGHKNDIGDEPGEMPPEDTQLGGDVLELSYGMRSVHQCALLKDLQLRCWGSGMYGRLGLGSTANIGDDELPTEKPFVPYQ